ncbi:uncharacterized protein LOC142760334 [Rhinoderma darwinii]|uniref:uncharacterized protein LOC142760334 n=1 Tax=Rhinoderma darwinii TaxID=43563 RepID=UPI003F670182
MARGSGRRGKQTQAQRSVADMLMAAPNMAEQGLLQQQQGTQIESSSAVLSQDYPVLLRENSSTSLLQAQEDLQEEGPIPDLGLPQLAPVHVSQHSPMQPAITSGLTEDAIFSCISRAMQAQMGEISSKIAAVHQDLHKVGAHMQAIETKMTSVTARVNQNTRFMEDLQEQLEEANTRIEDLENRSRRYNFRIRGVPESQTEVPGVVRLLLTTLIPDISESHMEIDRAHRALTAMRRDGLPRDIIVKLHYYSIKEKVMERARKLPVITIYNTAVQIYADLAPQTIQKRRMLRPILQTLKHHAIPYRWAFPFRLLFMRNNRQYGFSTLQEGEDLLRDLHILPPQDKASSSRLPIRDPPLSPIWRTQGGRPEFPREQRVESRRQQLNPT